jgi:hypothetical protein
VTGSSSCLSTITDLLGSALSCTACAQIAYTAKAKTMYVPAAKMRAAELSRIQRSRTLVNADLN